MATSHFGDRLADGDLLILDGATGTELTRRGVDTSLPLWSAAALIHAPDVLRAIHADYVRAGADLITANTFRTHRRSLSKAGIGGRARELTRLAVELARASAPSADTRAYVAGSIAPLEDCYAPELAPPDDDLRREHAEMARHLSEAGVDVMLVETMNTIREACIAAEAAHETGLPVIVSFVLEGATGLSAAPDGEARLLSGESLRDAVRAVEPLAPAAIMINCVPVASVARALRQLRAATSRPIGAYGNVGHVDDRAGWTLTQAVTPEQYAAAARDWHAVGARIIGGCCGTTPAHIAALCAALSPLLK